MTEIIVVLLYNTILLFLINKNKYNYYLFTAGLKELKVFVDLASISAGEGDYEIDKVNCLHSATTGYSPLIFSLDQNCDAALFLHRCEEVWKELKADSKLPKKLVRCYMNKTADIHTL